MGRRISFDGHRDMQPSYTYIIPHPLRKGEHQYDTGLQLQPNPHPEAFKMQKPLK
jgi:hypothetical protein